MNYAYTNIKNLTIKNIVILGKFFKKLFFRNKKNKIKNILKNLSLCRVGVRYALPPPVLLFSRILYCTAFYKITKIVRPLWLAESVFAWGYVNMVVASKCFAFRALITQARIWKSFRVQNSTSLLYLPIPSSAETWKIVTKKVCQFFFA